MLLNLLIGLIVGLCSTALWAFFAQRAFRQQFPNPENAEDCVERIKKSIHHPQVSTRDIFSHIGKIILIFAPLFILALSSSRVAGLSGFLTFFTISAFLMLHSTIKSWKKGTFFQTSRCGHLLYKGKLLERGKNESLYHYLRRELHAGLDFYRARRNKLHN
jgi:uncharacterized membrane protein YkgB